MGMTEQEALKELECAVIDANAYEVCKKALEKQIAKKPIWNTSDFINRHHCAICDGIIYAEQQYCDNCGQKLDWGE